MNTTETQTAPIECIGYSEEFRYSPPLDAPGIQELILSGKIVPVLSSTVFWWLDLEMNDHWKRVRSGDPLLQFKVVQRPGIEVRIDGPSRYTNKTVGFAGGLGPSGLGAEISKIRMINPNFGWVDMESKLRSDDWFNVEYAIHSVR